SRRYPFPSNRVLLLAAIVTGACAFLLRLKWPVGVNWPVGFNNFVALQLAYFASYVVLFTAGCLGAHARWLDNLPPSQVKFWRRIAWLTLPVLPLLALVGPQIPALRGAPEG